MKPIEFAGHSVDVIRSFPTATKREAGYQLDRVQRGYDPTDWKPMPSIGPGVREIRIRHEGQFRIVYVAKFKDAVHVLHVFQKKTQKTSKKDLETARHALKAIQERRKQ